MLNAQNQPDCECSQCLAERLDSAEWEITELQARVCALDSILNAVVASHPTPEQVLQQLDFHRSMWNRVERQSAETDTLHELQLTELERVLQHYTQVAEDTIEVRRAAMNWRY